MDDIAPRGFKSPFLSKIQGVDDISRRVYNVVHLTLKKKLGLDIGKSQKRLYQHLGPLITDLSLSC